MKTILVILVSLLVACEKQNNDNDFEKAQARLGAACYRLGIADATLAIIRDPTLQHRPQDIYCEASRTRKNEKEPAFFVKELP